jgi:hypothetical protein
MIARPAPVRLLDVETSPTPSPPARPRAIPAKAEAHADPNARRERRRPTATTSRASPTSGDRLATAGALSGSPSPNGRPWSATQRAEGEERRGEGEEEEATSLFLV